MNLMKLDFIFFLLKTSHKVSEILLLSYLQMTHVIYCNPSGKKTVSSFPAFSEDSLNVLLSGLRSHEPSE
jgi:hypothetical protein